MNAGKPVLTSTIGEKGLRDPFVIRSPEGDKFYLIATDLRMYQNSSGSWDQVQRHGSKSVMVWESTDLVNWTDQRLLPVTQAEYDRLLAAYPETPASVMDATAKDLKAYAVVTEETSKVVLPMEPDVGEAALRRLAPKLWVAEGATVSPESGTRRDFRRCQKYTVTAADGTKRVWTVEAVPARSPVLPGLYADPDIKYLNGRYWIYPTTDGCPGWSGTRFKAFSSKDLVNWKDHGVILDLGPDVSWADGHAWAPAIAERDGKTTPVYGVVGDRQLLMEEEGKGHAPAGLGRRRGVLLGGGGVTRDVEGAPAGGSSRGGTRGDGGRRRHGERYGGSGRRDLSAREEHVVVPRFRTEVNSKGIKDSHPPGAVHTGGGGERPAAAREPLFRRRSRRPREGVVSPSARSTPSAPC